MADFDADKHKYTSGCCHVEMMHGCMRGMGWMGVGGGGRWGVGSMVGGCRGPKASVWECL